MEGEGQFFQFMIAFSLGTLGNFTAKLRCGIFPKG